MSSILSPKDHLGFEVGEDRCLADWPQIVEYFHILDESSDRVQTREIGKTTEGNPFLLSVISSPRNLANLERYRAVQARLADPRAIRDEREADALIAEGKAVVAVTCSIHATEVGAAQMSMWAAHHLATSDDEDVRRILDNVILLLIPCLNPDGLILVKKWYDSTLGTPHEGVIPPYLYHKYAGHDNNRDWSMFTQAETRLTVERCLNAWHPQILYDLHQTRTPGMRMILPPYIDPVGPNVDPILQGELAMLGSAMANELTARGKEGVAINVVYDAYSPSRSYQHYHGGIRVLSEAASVRIATPISLERSQLQSIRAEDPTKQSWNHPMPWKGGRWSLRHIVEYDFAAVMACLDNAARYRDTWVRNFYRVGKRAVSPGGDTYAFVIPCRQRDPKTASELLDVLSTAAVEIHTATGQFVVDGRTYAAGARVVLMAQPYGAFAKTMLETRRYPDLRQYPGGPPRLPYDVTAHSLPLKMDVEVVEAKTPFDADLEMPREPAMPAGRVIRAPSSTDGAYLLGPESNASARAVNRLLAAGAGVGWARERLEVDGSVYPPGTFIIEGGGVPAGLLDSLAEGESLTFTATARSPEVSRYRLRAPKVGLYKSHVPNAEEGWTRFIFDDYGFAYTSLVDGDIRAGGLAGAFDAIVLPHQKARQIHRGYNAASYPAEYAGGLGEEGANSLRDFVERGGTLIAWDGAVRYAIRHIGLPARNVLEAYSHSAFFSPGSLLRVLLDTEHPVAYGMSSEAAAMFLNGPALDLKEGRVIGKFPYHNPLLSGWLLGHEKLHGRAALAAVPLGDGEAVLIGFRPNFRAQVRGTYKILFNSLYYSAAVP